MTVTVLLPTILRHSERLDFWLVKLLCLLRESICCCLTCDMLSISV